jgi:hypothetical protein
MKKIFLLIFLAISLKSFAYEGLKIPFYNFRLVDGMNMIDLESSANYPKVELDCHSFIMGLNFYDENGDMNYNIVMTDGECNYLMDKLIRKLSEEKACFFLDPDSKEYSVEDFSKCQAD